MSLNIAIVGPGRSKQGTGPFIARTFNQLGHTIRAVVSSSLESAQNASQSLANEYSIDCKAYSSLEELLQNHTIDIVVISSPANSHLQHLQTALENNCHVFCEKPLWWSDNKLTTLSDIDSITSQAITLVKMANTKKLVLQLNTQWPYTLPTYFELYPQLGEKDKTETFSMWLSPQSEGDKMIIDAVPHALSMLYTLVGAGKINNIESNFNLHINEEALCIDFDYIHATGDTRVTISLASSTTLPKPAAYAVNDLRVDRHVELPNYLISLCTTDKQIPVIDPLECSIKNFISSIHSKCASDEVAVVDGMTHLAQIYQAVTQQ